MDKMKDYYGEVKDFQNDIAGGRRNFSKVVFGCDLILSNQTFDEDFNFEECKFNIGFHISGVTFNGNVNFDKSRFSQVQLSRTINIEAKFNGKKTSFKFCTFNKPTNFNDSEFSTKVNFDETVFIEKALFQSCKFNDKSTFYNTKFLKLADFYHASFNKVQIFFKTDFEGNAVFSRATFNENVCFYYVSGKSNLIFRHANFKKGLDLSLAIINDQINFFNVKLGSFKSVKDPADTPEGAVEYDNYIDEGIITHKNRRETYRIIKDELISQNNVIDSLIYKSLEMEAFQKELKDDSKWRVDDRIILFLSFISNNFGKWWWLGVLFTFGISFFFYSIAVLFIEDYPYTFGWGDSIKAFNYGAKYYFQFLIPTHKIDFMKEDFDSFNLGYYVSDVFGRIFVGFGIYQTIIAFRKFSKK